jgi:hypothetical protein
MRVMLLHKLDETVPEAYTPPPKLIADVGKMVSDARDAGLLRDGAGLRSPAHGVRVTFAGGKRTVQQGPYSGGTNEDPAAICILRTRTIVEATDHATSFAAVLGDGVCDIRPVTEPWDLGFGEKPKDDPTTRYMLVWKSDPKFERGELPSLQARAALGKLIVDLKAKGVFLQGDVFKPTASSRRIPRTTGPRRVIDGPFAESKELISGFLTLELPSLEAAMPWADRYIGAVGEIELDLRVLYEVGELQK